MEYKSKKIMLSIILWTMFYALQFKVCFTFSWQEFNETEAPAPSPAPSRPSFPRQPYNESKPPIPSPSSFYFKVEGDPIQDGFIRATVRVGKDLRRFVLDVDTGSDLTWITCSPTDIEFLKPLSIHHTPNSPYVTNNNVMSCDDASVCGFVEKPRNSQCSQQCDYQVEYGDHGTSLGVLVKDTFLLSSSLNDNPLQSNPNLIFGCGYHQEFSTSVSPPFVDGVLGLGSGKTSILSQLSGDQGLIKKVVTLCSSDKDGPGYLVFGDSPSPRFTWRLSSNNNMELNMLGPAKFFYGNHLVTSRTLHFLLDSGTTYSYFSSSIYRALLSRVRQVGAELGTRVVDRYLPICWKPAHAVSSLDFLGYYEPIYLSFTDEIFFAFGPFDYLVISPRDNVCLGILESKELGADFKNLNIIGGLPLHNRLVVFDYENQEIGWDDMNCSVLPTQPFWTRMHHLKKMKDESHKGKDIGRWHMRKNRKMQHF